MKAIMMHEFGGPEVLKYEDLPTPEAGPDDVLVKVHAVSVNRTLDLVVRENNYARTPPLPHILGVDPSGVIEAVGDNVSERKVGDRVYVSLFVPSDDPDAMNLPGVGPFLHDDPDNRPDAIFDNTVILHVGPDRPAHVLLPIIPEK